MVPGGYENLGITYSAGTFTVCAADLSALSATNPGVVYLPSQVTPGTVIRHLITANQTFIDDAGASTILNNLFGYVTSVAIVTDVPFFIYCNVTTTDTTPIFGLCRVPGKKYGAATANIGMPSTANADVQTSMFMFSDVTAASYNLSPCVMVGSIRMRMSASDDWTVQALTRWDGIGQFQESTQFSTPTGQFGANASTITIANAGTAPVFTTTSTLYTVTPDGFVTYLLVLNGDAGTDGSGAVSGLVTIPFKVKSSVSYTIACALIRAAAGNYIANGVEIVTNQNYIQFWDGATVPLTWGAFTNGARYISCSLTYKIDY